MQITQTFKRFSSQLFRALQKGYRLPVFLGLLSTYLIFIIDTTSQPTVSGFLDRMDNLLYDLRYEIMLEAPEVSEHKIVIVDYDQKSLETEGQWPWSRFKIGDMVEKLTEYGVLVIGFDVSFPEYERNLINELQERATNELEGRGILNDLQSMEGLLDGDAYFAEKMQLNDVVLGFSFRRDVPLTTGILPEPLFRIDQSLKEQLTMAPMQGYVGNVNTLQSSASGAGFFDTQPDDDGIIRRSPLVLQYRNQFYPSLALEMARLYYFEDKFDLDVKIDPTGNYTTVRGINMGSVHLPTDDNGQVLVPYKGQALLGSSNTYLYISATDVLRGTLAEEEKEALFNSLVLVGSTATGLFDLRSTPMEAVYPGVEIHANILNAILNSSTSVTVGEQVESEDGFNAIMDSLNSDNASPFPYRPDWADGMMYTLLVFVGVLLSFIYPRLGPGLLSVSSVVFLIGVISFNFQLWQDNNLDLPLVSIIFVILLVTVVNMAYGFLREGLNRRVIKGMFDQYVPPAHIDAMLNDPDNYNFDGDNKEMSVLFSDIRGFTSISEKLSATQLKTMLNEFFTPITGIIFGEQGTIDKYVGDMVMAFWGAPLDDPEHRNHAVTAALKMLEKVEELKPEFVERGLPEINIGVGINTGFMNVGDMGSTYRRSYTVLGDAVNLGSRLESITKFYGVKLLIGEETFDHIDGFLCRLVDKVQVKGKEEPIRIYQPLCLQKDAPEKLVALVWEYHQAYELYLGQNWDGAVQAFTNLKAQDPDTYLYTLYLERIESLRNDDLGGDWDGTFRHTSK